MSCFVVSFLVPLLQDIPQCLSEHNTISLLLKLDRGEEKMFGAHLFPTKWEYTQHERPGAALEVVHKVVPHADKCSMTGSYRMCWLPSSCHVCCVLHSDDSYL